MPTMNTGRSSPGGNCSALASACPCALERIGGEALDEAVVLCGQLRAIEAHGRRPQPVCRFAIPHRLRVIAEIIVGLAETKLER